MTAKSAAVFALDVSCSPEAVEKGRQIAMITAIDKMLYAPHDELSLVLTGTHDTLNPLHTQTGGSRYCHITVCSPLGVPTVEFLDPLHRLMDGIKENGVEKSDFLETLIVCSSLLHDKTSGKKYNRVIYLITDAKETVARREELPQVLQSLQLDEVTLVVVGVDFTETSSDMDNLSELPVKPQNERVLHFLCDSIGHSSTVLSIDDTLEGVSQLRPRKVLQRPLLKVVLSIGDIRLAVQLFTKAQEEKLPSMKRVTLGGKEIQTEAEYVRVGESGEEPTDGHDRIKAFRYGRSLIPCTEADLEAMKLPGLRSLEAVAFVPRTEIPPYILMGGVKAVLPLAGDANGQRGLSCLVRSMLELNRVLIVRHVRTKDAPPAVGVCVPADTEDCDCLYYAPLPFAEDVRSFRFANYEEVQCTSTEEQLVDSLIEALSVGDEVLDPSDTFNPSIQQCYGTFRAKLTRAETSEDDHEPISLLPQLQTSSTAFTAHGNPLQPVLEKAHSLLDQLATAFPFTEEESVKGDQKRHHWFRLPANVAAPSGDMDGSERAPSTMNPLTGGRRVEGSVVSASEVSTIAAEAPPTAIHHVTTVDPVGSFETLMNLEKDSLKRSRIMDEITEVILQLLRFSLKDAHYDKCDAALEALRQSCVAQDEAEYFNSFLIKLLVETKEMGRWVDYWLERVRRNKALRPITKKECASSHLENEAAADAFLTQDRSIPVEEIDDEMDDDLMDLIS